MNETEKPSDLMQKESLQWLEVVLNLNDGPQRFQGALMEAAQMEPKTPEDVMKLIGLACAAIPISEQDVSFAAWYRDYAQRLLYRAIDGLALVEATLERRRSSGLN